MSCCCCGGVRSPIAAFSRSVHCGSWRLQTHQAQTADHPGPLPATPAPKLPIPANQLQKVLVLQLLVEGRGSQLLLLLQPLLIHVPLREVRAGLCERAQREPGRRASGHGEARGPAAAPTGLPCHLQSGQCSPAAGVARARGQRARGPTS